MTEKVTDSPVGYTNTITRHAPDANTNVINRTVLVFVAPFVIYMCILRDFVCNNGKFGKNE